MRATLRHVAFTSAPLWLSRGSFGRAHNNRPLCLARHTITLPNLPQALDGLTITHLSDLHIGRLTTAAQLPRILEVVASAKGDMIAVTGDFIDLSLKVLDDVIAAMHKLSAPLGVYMVPGNHDYLVDPHGFVDRFRAAGLRLMLNEAEIVEHAGCRMCIAGVDFVHGKRGLSRVVHDTLRAARPTPSTPRFDLSLLLAHHPDAFDPACRHRVDLTLSGHTHGGQFILGNGVTRKGSLGLASLTSRYPRGLYRRDNSYLYVTTGIGAWFPLRVNCPAEVALLTLRRAPAHPHRHGHVHHSHTQA
ncbi:MAG: metallophosphoesterase [Planctomycetes bacterium]|nr:metallophosphoesterase [Planctomycetota bacterium]